MSQSAATSSSTMPRPSGAVPPGSGGIPTGSSPAPGGGGLMDPAAAAAASPSPAMSPVSSDDAMLLVEVQGENRYEKITPVYKDCRGKW